jgi:hypothetical protein
VTRGSHQRKGGIPNPTQHDPTQHNTTQHNTTQHNTTQPKPTQTQLIPNPTLTHTTCTLTILQEVKLGDAQRTRALFERGTRLALPPKKMKALFKRWLAYESDAGNGAGVEHVKQRAMEFVEGSMKA